MIGGADLARVIEWLVTDSDGPWIYDWSVRLAQVRDLADILRKLDESQIEEPGPLRTLADVVQDYATRAEVMVGPPPVDQITVEVGPVRKGAA